MSNLSRVAKHLRKNTMTPGVSPGRLAFLAGLSKTAVYKNVARLRDEGKEIYTNTRVVKGKRRQYYRMAG